MRFLFHLAVLSALTVGTAAAQDRVSELEDNVNAAGFTRRSMPLRIGAEAGMGLLGEALLAVTEMVIPVVFGMPSYSLGGDGHGLTMTHLFGPALMAGGVYLGGRWTGGRGSFEWTFLGSYGGFLVFGGAYLLSKEWFGSTAWADLIPYPLWWMVGSLVAYEVTDGLATDRLKKKRRNALKQAGEPLMFQLLTLPF